MYATEESDVEIDAVKEIFKAAIKKDDRHQHQVLTKLNENLLAIQLGYYNSYQIVILTL